MKVLDPFMASTALKCNFSFLKYNKGLVPEKNQQKTCTPPTYQPTHKYYIPNQIEKS